MGKRTSYDPGTFCWVDLGTTNTGDATRFYTGLFEWEAEEIPVGDGQTYTMCRLDGDDVAAIFEQQAEQREQGVPPHWDSYVTVDDAAATATRAKELGGTVMMDAFDVDGLGRMAVLQDPTGAAFALWEPKTKFGAERVNEPGLLCWNELATPDPERAASFYSDLFGWGFEPIDTGEGGPELMGITNSAEWRNGSTNKLEGEMAGIPPNWMPYFGVESCPDGVARAKELDGQVVVDTLDIPTGHLAVLRDPEGATFGILDGEMDP